MSEAVAIAEAGAERLDELEPLWSAMHEHHRSVAGHLEAVAPFRPAADSWRIRSGRYRAWLAAGDAFLLLAERPGAPPLGYALVRVGGTEATIAVGERVADLASLSVAPSERGRGIGTALLDAVERELAARGVCEYTLSVMEGNEDARRLYARRGLVPYLTTLIGRVPG